MKKPHTSGIVATGAAIRIIISAPSTKEPYDSLKACYRHNLNMIDQAHIKRVATHLGRAANAERVILFGSHARGDAGENSDVDLMIIAESELPRFKRSRELYKLLRPHPFGMDLLVYTPQEVEEARRSPVSFVSTVFKEGKTVYVRPDRNRTSVAGESQE